MLPTLGHSQLQRWRACRKAVVLAELDPLTDATNTPAEAVPASPIKAGKRVKSAAIIDQLDEMEVEPLTRTELDRAYACHVEVASAEPTHKAEQLAVVTVTGVQLTCANLWKTVEMRETVA